MSVPTTCHVIAPYGYAFRPLTGDGSMSSEFEEHTKYLTRKELAKFLQARGFPISLSSLHKLCAPSLNLGPPEIGRWNSRPLYEEKSSLAWAHNRIHGESPPAIETYSR
jgi:hypothetical protein